MVSEINIVVGGEAGQGVQTIGFVLAKALARVGLHVFADQDYESRVRGGHNFFRIRASETEVQAYTDTTDILVALNQETMELHRHKLKTEGLAIFDENKVTVGDVGLSLLKIPLEELATEAAGNKVMSNSVAAGAAFAAAGYDFPFLDKVIREHFVASGGITSEGNALAAKFGYNHVRQSGATLLPAMRPTFSDTLFLNGNEAIALGAMAAGLKFIAAYPMTPTTSILEFIADKGKQYNIAVIQPEDEIAAINMIIGAAFAGVRSMTVTSGSGYALMVEGIGMAGISETPIVVVLGMRSGPAVGLPTRTEQGELGFAIHGGTGEFPKGVLAPATIEECFHLTVKAFNLAEKYQTPVILLTDQHLATSYQTVNRFDFSQVRIERGQLLSREESSKATEYKRHRFTESGVSPRALPLRGTALVVTDSDEHDESGHMIEDSETRTKMVLKRLKKYAGLKAEIGQPHFYKSDNAELTLVGWGSAYGAINEAVHILRQQGKSANFLHVSELWPFPSEAVTVALSGKKPTIVIENNATGQLARLIRAETGLKADWTINKFDGRPFSARYIVEAINKEISS